MPQESQRKLYDFVSARNYDLGDFETFKSKMANPDSRRKFYDFISSQNFDLGDFNTFESKVKPEEGLLSTLATPVTSYLRGAVEKGVKDVSTSTGKKPEEFTAFERAKTAVQGFRQQPIVSLTKLTGMDKLDIEALPNVNIPIGVPGVSVPLQHAAGVARPVIQAAEGLTTGENLTILGFLSRASAPIRSLGSLGFAVLMAKELPAQWQAFKEAKTPAQKTEALTAALLNLGMTGAAATHATKFPIAKARELTGVAPEFAEPRPGKITPETLVAAKTKVEEAKKAEETKIKAKQALEQAQKDAETNLETPQAQLNALAEQLAGKPLTELSATEQGKFKRQARSQYDKLFRQNAEVIAFEQFDGKSLKEIPDTERGQVYAAAKEQIRQELLANRPKPVETVKIEPEIAAPFDTAIEEKIAAGKLAEEITKSVRPETKPTPEERTRQEHLKYIAKRLENEIGPVPTEADLGTPPVRPRPEAADLTTRQALQEDWQANGVKVGDLQVDATPQNIFEQVSGKAWTPEVERTFTNWRKTKGSKFELGDAEIFANEYKPVETIQTKTEISGPTVPSVEVETRLQKAERLRKEALDLRERRQALQAERLAEQERKRQEIKAQLEKKYPGKVKDLEKPREPESIVVASVTPTAPEAKNIASKPSWSGKAYRVDTGYKHERNQTADNVVRYEQDELGNDLGVNAEILNELKNHSASDLIWVTKTKKGAERYGTPNEINIPADSKILAEDGDGGFLVLKNIAKKETPLRVPDAELPIVRASAQLKQGQAIKKSLIDLFKSQDIPAEEWPARIKPELEKAGIAPKIIQHLTEPIRLTRPTNETGTGETTTRAGRIERTIKPPPELKSAVDEIAEAAKQKQVADADYDTAIAALDDGIGAKLAELKKLGEKVYFDSEHGVYKLESLRQSRYTKEALEQLNDARQKLADAGAYTVEDIGEGVEIAATPGVNYEGKPVTGDLTAIANEAIRRKNVRIAADKNLKATKEKYQDNLTDYYFSEEQHPALKGISASGEPVEIQVRQQRSATEPAVLPEWYKKLKQGLPKEQGDPYISLFKVARKTVEKAQAAGEGRFLKTIRENLSEEDNTALSDALKRMNDAGRESMESANVLPLSAFLKIERSLVEAGYYVSKAIVRATGKAIANKAEWAARMIAEFGEDIRPFVNRIWDRLQAGWEPGKPLPEMIETPVSVKTPLPKAELLDKTEARGSVGSVPILKSYAEPIIKTVKSFAPKLAGRFRTAIDYWEKREGESRSILTELKRDLRYDLKAFDRLNAMNRTVGDGAWTNMAEWITNPDSRPIDLTLVEKRVLDTYSKLVEKGRNDVINAGGAEEVHVPFKRVPSLDLIEAIRQEGGIVWDTMVDTLQKLNPELTRENITHTLRNYQLDKFGQFPTHISMRGKYATDFVPVLAADGVSALDAVIRDYSRRAGIIRVFGPEYYKQLKALKESLPASQRGDFQLVIDSYFGARRIENTRNMAGRTARMLSSMVSSALLAKSGLVQIGQAPNVIRISGVGNFVKGLSDFIRHPGRTRAELEAIGAYAPSILEIAFRKGQRIEDLGRLLTHVAGNLTLLRPLVQMTDLAIGSAMKRLADGIKERGGKLTNSEKATLKALDFNDGQIKLINEKGLSGYTDADVLHSAIISRGRKAVTFTGKKGPELTKFQQSPMLSELWKFQGFTIGQLQSVIQQVDTIKNTKGAVRAHAIKNFGILLGTNLAMAEMTLFIRQMINGNDPDRPEDAKRLWEDLVEAGFLGPLRDISYAFNSGALPFVAFSVFSDFKDMLVGGGKYRDYEPYERAFMFSDRYALKPYHASYDMGKNIAIAWGLSEGNPTLKTANNAYWSWLKSIDAYEENARTGYDEVQASMRRMMQIVKDAPPDEPLSVTQARVQNDLSRILKFREAKVKAKGKIKNEVKIKKEAADDLRQSLLNRRPLTQYLNEKGVFVINHKPYTREEIIKGLRDQKYFDALVKYDRLIEDLAYSLSRPTLERRQAKRRAEMFRSNPKEYAKTLQRERLK